MSESSDISFSPISHTSPSTLSRSECKSEETIQQEKNLEFTAQLIAAVKAATILYDHSHKQYRNGDKKLEAWNYVKNKVGYMLKVAFSFTPKRTTTKTNSYYLQKNK